MPFTFKKLDIPEVILIEAKIFSSIALFLINIGNEINNIVIMITIILTSKVGMIMATTTKITTMANKS